MKATLRIPTDQYAFVEVKVDGTPEEIKNHYESLKIEFLGGSGLQTREWNETLDKYLTEGNMDADKYANMSQGQQRVIQEIKKSYKRLNRN